ncbi:MAG: ABC transporter permease [Lachnospiraceae bacterium]|nr:ABC transporter permease [Lachnospiraceae bacterium]MBQ2577451.1 ABC transporter permease [Lachnospiraceae bacterium]MEE3354801.1 ABC transporter permease [Candidatus Weimeria sp.]
MKKRRYPFAVGLTISGYFLAVILNALFPQIADVKTKTYRLFVLMVDRNDFYRGILILLALLFLITGLLSRKDPKRRNQYVKNAPLQFALGIGLLLWDILGTKTQIFVQPFFPGPTQILESFLQEGGFIFSNTLYSLRLYLFGFLLGAAFGIGTGILIGWFPKVYYWVHPVLHITGIIPAVAWMPFALTLIPTAFWAAVFLIVICVWFPVASVTAQGIAGTPKVLLEAARTLGGSTAYQLFHVALPNALPQVFAGLSTANAFAFTTLVMAEMMGQPGGLGYYINLAKVWSSYYKVFAAILIMAILFSLITEVLNRIQSRVLRWQKGLLKTEE